MREAAGEAGEASDRKAAAEIGQAPSVAAPRLSLPSARHPPPRVRLEHQHASAMAWHAGRLLAARDWAEERLTAPERRKKRCHRVCRRGGLLSLQTRLPRNRAQRARCCVRPHATRLREGTETGRGKRGEREASARALLGPPHSDRHTTAHTTTHTPPSLLPLPPTLPQEADLVRLRREAKAAGGFYADPEPRVVLVVRIRGINDLHPKTRNVLQLLRLRQIHNAVFVKVWKGTGEGKG